MNVHYITKYINPTGNLETQTHLSSKTFHKKQFFDIHSSKWSICILWNSKIVSVIM